VFNADSKPNAIEQENMKSLYGQNWYTPREIAKQGLILNSVGEEGTVHGHYKFIIRLIKSGQLKARNYSTGKRPYYLVPEEEIKRYHEQWR
jgi:hypothetical protein